MQRPTKILFTLITTLTIFFTFSVGVSADSDNIFIAVDGSDINGNGSVESPFATLSKAGKVASPGTTIYVRGGKYMATEDYIRAQGSEAAPITIKPYNNETVIFDGTGADIDYFGSIFLILGSEHIIVEGFEIRNSSGRGISTYESSYITIRNNNVHHAQGRGMGGGGDHLVFENNEISHVVLENENEAFNRAGGWSSALRTAQRADGTPSTNIIFRNNHVHNVWGEGINALFADGVLIEGNEVNDAYGVNIYLDHASNVIVSNNHIYATQDSTLYRNTSRVPASGIGMANEHYTNNTNTQTKNITIENNVIENVTRGIGYWHDKENKDVENTYSNIMIKNNSITNASELDIKFFEVIEGYTQPEKLVIADNDLDSDAEIFIGNEEALETNAPTTTETDANYQVFIPIVIN